MFLFIIIPQYQNSFITSNMDDYLEKRRKKPVSVFLKRSDSSITSIGEISWNGIP